MSTNEELAKWCDSQAQYYEFPWRAKLVRDYYENQASNFRECAAALRKADKMRDGLSKAAYALFQIKRMVGVTDDIKKHSTQAWEDACKILDEET